MILKCRKKINQTVYIFAIVNKDVFGKNVRAFRMDNNAPKIVLAKIVETINVIGRRNENLISEYP